MTQKLHNLYGCILFITLSIWNGVGLYATNAQIQQDPKVKGLVVDEKRRSNHRCHNSSKQFT